MLLLLLQCDINLVDNMGRHSLHLAAQAGCHPSVTHLIQTLGVNVNLQSPQSQVTAMHLAAKVIMCVIPFFISSITLLF